MKIIVLNSKNINTQMIMYIIDSSNAQFMLEYNNGITANGVLGTAVGTTYATLKTETEFVEVNIGAVLYCINPFRVLKVTSGVILFDNGMTVTSTDSDSTINGLINTALNVGGGSPGGLSKQIQFNDAGSFGGDAGLTFDKASGDVTIGNLSGSSTRMVVADNDGVLSAQTIPSSGLTQQQVEGLI